MTDARARPNRPPARRGAGELLLFALIIVGAAVLRWYALDRSSLWSDEGNTWALIQRPFAQIAAAAAADIHPPGYYWLLRLWSVPFGMSALSMRSFSVLCGVLLVALTWLIGRRIAPANAHPWLPLLAALLAALNPFQIYYSQEARMYMLLALESALLAWLVLLLMENEESSQTRRAWLLAAAVTLAAAAGLWTHYSFPIVLAAAGAGWLAYWLRSVRKPAALLRVTLAYAGAALLFLPWLPTALRQITTWPQGGERTPLWQGLQLTLQTLLAGGVRSAPDPLWPWSLGAALLPLLGMVALRRTRTLWLLALWLLAPVGLMFGLGLFSDAFLKFLLVASTPWVLLCAAAAESAGPRIASLLRVIIAAGAVLFAALTLPSYYADPSARDNYQGVAHWVEWQASLFAADTQLVLLNAPGQADVWRYYDPGVEVLPIPAQRPPDAAQVDAELQAAVSGKQLLHALFWATDESDPDELVESWLNQNLFKGMESWQGNVRYVAYAAGAELECAPNTVTTLLGLNESCLGSQPVHPGAPVMVELRWKPAAPIEQAWKLSLQLLDQRSQVVAQQDGEPAGGTRPTISWRPGESVIDRHSLLVQAGTPAGTYRLALVAYDAQSGERLRWGDSDALELGSIVVAAPPDASPPSDLLPIAVRTERDMGPAMLLGYTQHRAGSAHAPDTPLQPGDALHLTLFWRAPAPLPQNWPADQTFTLAMGEQVINAPLAGGSYPTARWSAGEIVRAEFDIPYDGSGQRTTLTVDGDSLRLQRIPR